MSIIDKIDEYVAPIDDRTKQRAKMLVKHLREMMRELDVGIGELEFLAKGNTHTLPRLSAFVKKYDLKNKPPFNQMFG